MSSINWPEIIGKLKARFLPGQEQYRVGPTWDQDGGKKCRPLPFIDARAVFDRLDEVVGPENWSTDLERMRDGVYICRMTIHGVTKTDVGQAGDDEGEKDKSGASDAIKRAGVQWGIGRYLYDLDLPVVALTKKGDKWVLPFGWHPAMQAQAPGSQDSEGTTSQRNPSPPAAPKLASSKQINKIGAEMARVGWSEKEGREFLISRFNKHSRAELTGSEASSLIDHLVALPAKEVAHAR